jgi:hypothetical protein
VPETVGETVLVVEVVVVFVEDFSPANAADPPPATSSAVNITVAAIFFMIVILGLREET